MQNFYWNAEIIKGRLETNKPAFVKAVKNCFDGKYLIALIRTSNRDERQWQKYYRVILGEMSMELGYEKNELHEIVKADVLEEMGFSSTTELTAEDWTVFMERVKDWSHENFDFIM
jgi:hypothetical protein